MLARERMGEREREELRGGGVAKTLVVNDGESHFRSSYSDINTVLHNKCKQ